MNKKIVGIIVITLLILTVLSYGGINANNVKIDILDKTRDYDYEPGIFIVKFKEPGIKSKSVTALNDIYQILSIEKAYDNVENSPLDNIYYFYVSKDADILKIVKDYESLSNVEYAEPNYIMKTDFLLSNTDTSIIQKINTNRLSTDPNDPNFNEQWHLDNNGQTGGTSNCDINALDAWEIEKGSEEIVIAIMDSGIDYTHPDLVDNIWINEDEIPGNDIDDDNNGYIDDYYGVDVSRNPEDPENNTIDIVGHGTACAGVASAVTNNGIGIAGVCWSCKLMSVQFVWEDYTFDAISLIDGMKYATDNGADIISMSFGWRDIGITRSGYEYAYENGVVLIAAAMNRNESDPKYSYPAAYDYVMAVAATDCDDKRASFSNYGEWVDVAAPGNKIYTTMPTYYVEMNDRNNSNTGEEYQQNYDYLSGTSFSTPMVAGIAALLLSQDPSLTFEEIWKIICANVDPYFSDEYVGTGRVNAYKALTRFNTQPETPETPSGRTNGKPGREYKFKSSATDPDGDELWYLWDWGDGNFSEWLGPFNSGDVCEGSYIWQQEANFSIKVKSKDGKGGVSCWSEEFIFSTPKSKAISTPLFLQRFFHRFPIFEKILNQIK